MRPSWLDKVEYPFEANWFTVGNDQLHYVDEGSGSVILFVHGTPSWSFEYRHVIISLRDQFRCIAPDHIGFGLSDKPREYNYSTQKHSETLEAFILEKDLKDIVLVVHDFGGPIGLSVAIRHPQRVRKLVILNSWLWSSKGTPEFEKLKKFLQSRWIPFLYKYLNFSPRFILPASFGDNKIGRKTARQYTAPFTNRNERNGVLSFARSLVVDQDWFERLWHARSAISDKPTLFIWGLKDPIITAPALSRFQSGFGNSRTVAIERAGHFPQEEQPGLVAAAIRDFCLS